MRLKNLDAEMRRRSLRQQDIAVRLGCDRSRISRILCGHIRARAREKRAIAEALGLPVAVFFPCRRHRSRRSRK